MRSRSALLQRCIAFENVASSTLDTLTLASRFRTVARRAPLGAPLRAPLVVRSGVVRELASDRPVTYGFYGRNDLVGIELLFGRSAPNLEAYDDCVVLDLPLRDLRRCMERDPGMLRGLLRWEHQRVQQLKRQLLHAAHGPAPQRLAGMLHQLGQRFGVRDSRGTIINLRLPHRELAALIGSTRETVSHTVGRFKRQGWIVVEDKRFVLLDTEAIRRFAEEGPR